MELLQIATAQFITKCDGQFLQIATAFLLQSATRFITNCDSITSAMNLLKIATVLQSAMNLLQIATVLQSAMNLLQIATRITKCDEFITNCDRYYKVR